MKILIVGATGTIGKHVTAALQKDHEIIKVASKSADIQIDISSTEAIENFYKQVGKFDALICAAGDDRAGESKIKIMKILILGATGRTGRLIVEEALKQGYDLNVLVRDKNIIPFSSKSIKVFQGTPARRTDLAAAMQGCDLIISALSIARASDAPWSKLITPEYFISESMKNVIAEAGHQNLKRLITISAWGVGETQKEIPFWLKWLINHTNLRPVYAEHESQEKLLANSNLNWTAVRPVALNDSKKIKTLKASFNNFPKPSLYISRQSVAKFMVDIVKSDTYDMKSPTISEN